jgi:hypothetical protein
MTTGTIVAITASGLAIIAIGYGLYRLGKNVQSGNITIKRPVIVKNLDNDEIKIETPEPPIQPVKVDFHKCNLLTFEEIAKWIGSVDIPDAESENLICHLVRYGKELSSYNIDLSELSDDEIKHIVVAHVMDEKSCKIYSSKWYIANSIDTDLSETFGSDESVNLK